jgi:hypothetical protein
MVGLFLWSPNPPLPWRWSSPPGVAALPPFRPSAGRRLGCFLDISIVLCSWRRLFALLFGVRWARSLRQGQAPLGAMALATSMEDTACLDGAAGTDLHPRHVLALAVSVDLQPWSIGSRRP